MKRRSWFTTGMVLTILLRAAVSISLPAPVLAGHTIDGGTCWKGSTPLLCRTNYDCTGIPQVNLDCGTNQVLRIRLLDYFSDNYPGWRNNANEANEFWNAGAGYQDFSFLNRSDDSWIYLLDSPHGEHGLTGNGSLGVTFNCNSSAYCTNTATAMDIANSRIYFDRSNVPPLSENEKTHLFMHEYGHAIGLFHHNNSSFLMYYFVDGTTDLQGTFGQTPRCDDMAFAGLRCIYKW